MSIVVSRYACALYQTAHDSDYDVVVSNIKLIDEIISQNSKLTSLLRGPRTKLKVISALTEGMSVTVIQFYKVLLKGGRVSLLGAIAKKFLEICKEKAGLVDVIVTSVTQLSSAMLDKIKLSMDIEQNINIINNIDKSILGGIVIRYKNSIADLSLRYRLEKMQAISKKGVLKCG